MSYILDALQRAEAERERGQVPGLQTRAVTPPTLAPTSGPGKRMGLAIAVALAVCTLAIGLWVWRTPVAMDPAVLTAVDTPEPSVAIVPTPAAVTPRAVAAVTAPVARKPPQPDIQSEPPPASRKPEVAQVKRVEVDAKAPVNTPLLKDLPDALRQQIPALAISGAVYSANPAQRLLLVNGQVLSQGNTAAPDVILEEIHPTTSEFSFRGTRFRMAH